jgi:hypothetical protein
MSRIMVGHGHASGFAFIVVGENNRIEYTAYVPDLEARWVAEEIGRQLGVGNALKLEREQCDALEIEVLRLRRSVAALRGALTREKGRRR